MSGSLLARPSESDALDTTINADPTHYTTISAPTELNIAVGSASSAGTYKVQSETITTKTNSPSGYSLYLSLSGSDNKLYRSGDTSGNYLGSTTGTKSSPAALTTNTWGFSTDSSVTSSNVAKYYAVPASGSEMLI